MPRLDHIAVESPDPVGLFFEDPDGRLLEALTYKRGDDPRKR